MKLFGYPVVETRQLMPCGSVVEAVAAYEAGFLPLVHPSLEDEVYRAIEEAEQSRALISQTPAARAMREIEFSEWGTSAICMVDGSIALLDCRPQHMKQAILDLRVPGIKWVQP